MGTGPSTLMRHRIDGVVPDSPALNWRATVRQVGGSIGIPPLVTESMLVSSSIRYGIDWSDHTELSHSDELQTPILLFHAIDDPAVPVAVSDQFAASRPDLVTYLRVPLGGHVGSWNADPALYDAVLRAFLNEVPSPRHPG